MKRRLLSLLLVLALLGIPALAAEDAAAPLDSGLSSLPKLTREEIVQLLSAHPLGFAGDTFTVQPSPSAPYATGTLADAPQQAALGRLNLFRRLAGLNDVALDADLGRRAQYGAVLLAAGGKLTHRPERPADMDDTFYQNGLNGTTSSNIYMGTGATLPQAVDGFMDDSDTGNLPTLGHRRWLLNPAMGKTGFGFSDSVHTFGSLAYNFAALWAFDHSAAVGEYRFIAWPASGAFPSTLFASDHAWSVTLDPSQYTIPATGDLRVTLRRASDGGSWVLDGGQTYAAANSGAYLRVDTGNYGVGNCIIFRPPEEATAYKGVYTVTIDGLKTAAGAAAPFSYQVDFFDPNATPETPPQPTQPAQPVQPVQPKPETGFSDVPADAWYAEDVTYAVRNGLFNGVGEDRFDPDGPMTRVMLMTVLARLDGVDTTPSRLESWYIKGHRWAVTNRISDGLDPHDPLTLEELTTMLYNYAKFRRGATAATVYHLAAMPDGNDVSSWAAEGTNWMVDQGLLNGDENHRLNPQRIATRSQVAALLHRYLNTLEKDD